MKSSAPMTPHRPTQNNVPRQVASFFCANQLVNKGVENVGFQDTIFRWNL